LTGIIVNEKLDVIETSLKEVTDLKDTVDSGTYVMSLDDAFCTALEVSNLDAAKLVVKAGAKLDGNIHALTSAIESDRLEIIKYVLESDNNLSLLNSNPTEVIDALHAGDGISPDIIKYLMEKGLNIHSHNDGDVLLETLANIQDELLMELLDAEPDYHNADNNLLRLAKDEDNEELQDYLINRGAVSISESDDSDNENNDNVVEENEE
jgi:hypothetical protein